MSIATPYLVLFADSAKKKSSQPLKPVDKESKHTATSEKTEKPVATNKDTSKHKSANLPMVIVSKPYVKKDTTKHAPATTTPGSTGTKTTNKPKTDASSVQKDTTKHTSTTNT